MPRALEATCIAGVVKVGSLPVAGVEILSEGVGSSEGVLILDGEKRYYIADTTPDLKTTLEKLASVLTQIATALAAIDVKPFGAPGSTAPVAATTIAQITALQVEVAALKETLK